MPLPTADTIWPPTDPTVQNALADWDAWYSAEPDRLEQRYSGRGYRQPADRPAQHRGGVVGRVARWFWGNPTPDGEKRSKLHVPLAGDIARTSSGLLFSEPPKFIVENNKPAQDRLDALRKSLHPRLLEAGELCAALGGVYFRLVWDDAIADRPWIDCVAADRAVPEFSYGRLRAVTFWTVLDSGDVNDRRVFRHLEKHERGRIYHGLYEGSLTNLGAVRPLTDHPATEPLAAMVDETSSLDTGAPDHLTASYMPNVRPARGWRHIPSAAAWGQSDFQGIEGIMDAFDESWSSWMRDLQDGKGRIIVADSLLQSNGPGQGASWNEDQRVYAGLNMLPRAGDPNPITSIQFAIRYEEHMATCAALLAEAARQAGYSASSFGEHGDGQAITATEVKAKERRSLITKARKELYADPALSDILAAQLAVESGFRFGVDGVALSEPPEIEFQDSISEGLGELATTAEMLRRAEAASTETLVALVNPGFDKDQITAEADKIRGESGRVTADPFATGAEGEGVPHAGVSSNGGGPRP
ncbi:hypothetical protein [Streptomyces sp. NRRL B-24720]|uniref:hypothetical protein n=1 Tax=Streptomyces sp. NRRL B-24720 TaxID=1476876 RepID=UPI0007C533C7|nr:hypothetical protein [Streptomyces sp. NRRL B-24720]